MTPTTASPASQDNRVENGIILQPTGEYHSRCESRQPVFCDVSSIPWPVSDRFTPLGYHVALTDRFAALSTIPGGRAPLAPSGQPASLLHVPGLEALRARPDTWRRKLQKFTGLLDRPDNHSDPRLRAAVLTHAAAVGLPVCLTDDSGLRGFLPDKVLDLWRSTEPSDLRNPYQRDRIAFRQWSAVLDSLSMRSTWNRLLTASGKTALRPRRISVLAVTRRPKMLQFWAQLLAAQDYPDFEVIAGFHGSAFTRKDESLARNWLGDRLTILRATDDCVLGDVLNQVTAAASGELIVKWDDDDLYSSGHLSDLARIYEYSGATMVGKAAEYIYLAASNMTIRFSMRSSELTGFRMSGNTLCLPREELLNLGGWQPVPRSVDTRLVMEIIRRGGQLYRGVGFGHLVLRSPHNDHNHTWIHPDREMMRYCRDQRPGVDADFAMVDVPAELLARWPYPRRPGLGQESDVA
ncbi:MAG: glycosyltransferase [Planctomycetaceae bacterium]|nr:glycosyltransferase [Planctomycetaceae bacterium]